MNVFHSQMHLFTLVFLLLELMLFTFQIWYYYSWPQEKSRLWYLILLGLLIIYNLTGGLFPDPDILFISVQLQNIIAFGSGFLVASYIPFYFYKAFHLQALRFQAIYAVPIFLLTPYFIFFVLFYSVTGDITSTIKYGMVIPFFYTIVLAWSLYKAICTEYKAKDGSMSSKKRIEMRLVFCAAFPWTSLTVITFFSVPQWLEVLITNFGFVIITILFMIRLGRNARAQHKHQILLQESLKNTFYTNCKVYHLTKRESEVAELLCQGLTYREIGQSLFISEKTVDTHVQRIFPKTGSKKVIELLQKLSYQGAVLVVLIAVV